MSNPENNPGGAIRISGDRGRAVQIMVDGQTITAYDGETVAGALMAIGQFHGRRTPGDASRGYYCGMGVCWDCVVVIDGDPNVRACRTYIKDGMRIETQSGYGPVTLR